MAFHPKTTIYVLAGTGIDYYNSIWWHRFAYPYGDPIDERSWNPACTAFFKAHSISKGNWYCTFTDPMQGYVDIGKQFLVQSTNPSQGQEGLGYDAVNNMIANPAVAMENALRIADYLMISNEDSGDLTEPTYAWITRIESLNYSTARVYFTIDAIMSYFNHFCFGRCWVERDMQFGELTDEDKIPYYSDYDSALDFGINREPEPINVTSDEYIYSEIGKTGYAPDVGKDYTELEEFGGFTEHIVMSDCDLQKANEDTTLIGLNSSASGVKIPPSRSTRLGNRTTYAELGVGLFYVKNNEAPVFGRLGEFNALDHILASYSVPKLFFNENAREQITQLVSYIPYSQDAVNTDYVFDKDDVPDLEDLFEICPSLSIGGVYRPIHYKATFAPYNYYTVSDPFGNAMTIIPQFLTPVSEDEESNGFDYYLIYLRFIPTVSFNSLTELSVSNYAKFDNSFYAPLASLFQINTYSMTPNNSGSAIIAEQSKVIQRTSALRAGLIVAGMAASALITGGGSVAGALANETVRAGLAAGTLRQAGYVASTAYHQSQNLAMAEELALPSAVGGTPNGLTERLAQTCGYIFKNIHLPTKRIQEIDDFFSMYGYSQNQYRYPHINTNRHWNYVKLKTVNIVPNYGAWGTKGSSLPVWAKQQIEERLTAGVTFWNIRWGLEGDGDDGHGTTHTSYDDEIFKELINQTYIGYYGDWDYKKENVSVIDDYASEYSDTYDYIEVGKDIQ